MWNALAPMMKLRLGLKMIEPNFPFFHNAAHYKA
jgi:hypothetical protein